jgi:hypothetical protein
MKDFKIGSRLPGHLHRCGDCWAVTRFEKAAGAARKMRQAPFRSQAVENNPDGVYVNAKSNWERASIGPGAAGVTV